MQIDYSKSFASVQPVVDATKFGMKYPISLHITVRTWDSRVNGYTPDCQVGHFGYNFCFRTKAGYNGRKYQSVASMKRAISRQIKRTGLKLLGWQEVKDNGVHA